jgi:hypothetical protein
VVRTGEAIMDRRCLSEPEIDAATQSESSGSTRRAPIPQLLKSAPRFGCRLLAWDGLPTDALAVSPGSPRAVTSSTNHARARAWTGWPGSGDTMAHHAESCECSEIR